MVGMNVCDALDLADSRPPRPATGTSTRSTRTRSSADCSRLRCRCGGTPALVRRRRRGRPLPLVLVRLLLELLELCQLALQREQTQCPEVTAELGVLSRTTTGSNSSLRLAGRGSWPLRFRRLAAVRSSRSSAGIGRIAPRENGAQKV